MSKGVISVFWGMNGRAKARFPRGTITVIASQRMFAEPYLRDKTAAGRQGVHNVSLENVAKTTTPSNGAEDPGSSGLNAQPMRCMARLLENKYDEDIVPVAQVGTEAHTHMRATVC